jgi:hypothetical protein
VDAGKPGSNVGFSGVREELATGVRSFLTLRVKQAKIDGL